MHPQSDSSDDNAGNVWHRKCLFIHGPSGVGKTSLVYLIAKQLHYEVLEYNFSTIPFSSNLFHNKINESFESGLISTSSLKFFKPSDCDSNSNQMKLSKSVILLDDIDAVFYEEIPLQEIWRILKSKIKDSRKPVVITSRLSPNFLCDDSHFFTSLKLNPIKLTSVLKFFDRIFKSESVCTVQDGEQKSCPLQKSVLSSISFSNFPHGFGGDLRRTINHLNFWQFNCTPPELSQSAIKDFIETKLEDGDKDAIEMLSDEDIYENVLKQCNNAGLEADGPYNHLLSKERLSLIDSQHQTDHQNGWNPRFDDPFFQPHSPDQTVMRRFLDQHYFDHFMQQVAASTDMDYYNFLENLITSYPNLSEYLKLYQSQTHMTRSSRNGKSKFPKYL